MDNSVFRTEELKALKYNVFEVPAGRSILSAIPALAKLESFKAAERRGDIDNLIMYVVAMYDKNSPTIKYFQDITKRKHECAELAGYDLRTDKAILKELFDFTDKAFAEMVIEFLKDQNARVWSMIVSNEQTFYEYQKALLTEITMTDGDKDKLSTTVIKTKLMEDSDEICARLDKYYQLLFGEELTKRITEKFTPEGMAKR